jgi:hypothetical protein
MNPGNAAKGSYIYFVLYGEDPGLPAAQVKCFKVDAIHYRGTSNEQFHGVTYDADLDTKLYHMIHHKDAWKTKEEALHQAKMKLIARVQEAERCARSLGFSLGQ